MKELDSSECRILEADYENLLEVFDGCPFELLVVFDGQQMFSDFVGEIKVTVTQVAQCHWQHVYKPVNPTLSYARIVYDERGFVTHSEFTGIIDADLIIDISNAVINALK